MNVKIEPTFGGILGIAAVAVGGYLAYQAYTTAAGLTNPLKPLLDWWEKLDLFPNLKNPVMGDNQTAAEAGETFQRNQTVNPATRDPVAYEQGYPVNENPLMTPDGMDFGQLSG